MEELFNALLDISRLDAGVVHPHITTIPRAAVFHKVRFEYGPHRLSQAPWSRTRHRPTPGQAVGLSRGVAFNRRQGLDVLHQRATRAQGGFSAFPPCWLPGIRLPTGCGMRKSAACPFSTSHSIPPAHLDRQSAARTYTRGMTDCSGDGRPGPFGTLVQSEE